MAIDTAATSATGEARAAQLDVLFMSRLVPGKGLTEAIQAYALLKKSVPDATLTIAGAGSGREGAERQATGLRDVRFLGHVDDEAKKRAFYDANVYLFTSESEGMPTVVLEAMAHGLPVVTSAVGGLVNFFEHGRMGFMTESRDPAVYAGYMAKLSENPGHRYQISDYNCAYAEEHFAASKVAAKLQDIYAEAIRLDRLRKADSPWHAFQRWRTSRKIKVTDRSGWEGLKVRYLNAGGTPECWNALISS